jgi:hypothetical protein
MPTYQQPPPVQTSQTPNAQQTFRPPSANGTAPSAHHYQTPVTHQPLPQPAQSNPSPAGSNANAIAADGMSGPWPQESKAIPEKHDRSSGPAPPPQPSGYPLHSSPAVGEAGTGTEQKAVVPPVALSPSQQMQEEAAASGPGSVPVKRDPVIESNAFAATAQQSVQPQVPQEVSSGTDH